MQAFAVWLAATRYSAFVNGHQWVWPACETLHFIGLALLIGNVGLLDLRLLGFEKGLPFIVAEPLRPLGRARLRHQSRHRHHLLRRQSVSVHPQHRVRLQAGSSWRSRA